MQVYFGIHKKVTEMFIYRYWMFCFHYFSDLKYVPLETVQITYANLIPPVLFTDDSAG